MTNSLLTHTNENLVKKTNLQLLNMIFNFFFAAFGMTKHQQKNNDTVLF